MLKVALAGLLAFGLSSPCPAADPWTREDTAWETAYALAVALDWSQSRQIKELGRTERNPLLPEHPTPNTVTAICLGSVLGHALISYYLPIRYRRPFQVTTVALEVVVVADNYFRAGVRIRF